ncbi:hypothetical protein [uncultured Methylobacterium sp.]|uniref:hypothetical protein n=1 Tax=uncultured Methylobacterium sp. TaxID=157278 RepID=UPI002588D388|nr:hypothetical protein [uncultured Methylobacterium sp.]
MEKREYATTERAGRRVAGRVVAGAGETLQLTEAEAEHAVRSGELVAAGEELPAEFGQDSEVLAGMRADAARVSGRPGPTPPAPEPAPAEPAPAQPDAEAARRRPRTQPAAEPPATPAA